MSWARPDGSRATVALLDPLTGVPIPEAWIFPGRAGGSHAPGPFGQIEIPHELARSWTPAVPLSLQLQFVRIAANDPDNPFLPRDNLVWVDRPTLLRCTSSTGSMQGAQWFLTWSPWRNDVSINNPPFSSWQGVPFTRDVALLPAAGLYVLRAAAFGVTSSFCVLAAFDATNPEIVRPLLPRWTAGVVAGQADLALAAGNTVIFATTLSTMPHVALDVVNPNATAVRINWGGAAAANLGIQLGATGTEHDRIRFTADQIPLASLNVWKATAGSISVIRYL